MTGEEKEDEAPDESESKHAEQQIMSLVLRACEELRAELRADEDFYTRAMPSAIGAGRDYYLYGVLDQVERAILAFGRLGEAVREDVEPAGSDDRDRRILRNVNQLMYAEESLWQRKLTEVLTELIAFSTTPDDHHYLHYLLLQQAEHQSRQIESGSAYYGAGCANLEDGLRIVRDRIVELQKHTGSDPWYARRRGSATLPATVAKMLRYAMKHATKREKFTLGLEYGVAYGGPSSGLHWTLGVLEPRLGSRDLRTANVRIALLALLVLMRVRRILGIRRRKGALASLALYVRRDRTANELYGKITRRRVRKGDFVVVQNELAEVIAVRRSEYGYRSYKVRFLSKAPLPEITEDWYRAYHLRPFTPLGELRKEVAELLGVPHGQHARAIADSVRKSVLHLWEELGWRERAAGDHEAGQRKLEAWLKAQRDFHQEVDAPQSERADASDEANR